jgi:predicted MFS family arabinose efflux permease
MGAVMGAFSVAQVLGVPAALIVSERFGWRVPFYAVAVLGGAVALFCAWLLPSLAEHRARAAAGETAATLGELLSRPTVLLSYAMTAALMAAGFLVIPNLPAYVQNNLGYPRSSYTYLLAVGGVASFITLRLFGRLVDRVGSWRAGTAGVVASLAIMWALFVRPPSPAPVMLLYVSLIVALGARNVAYNALTTKVPRPHERARFLSLQSTVYHAVAGAAAWLSTSFLRQLPDGRLEGIPALAAVSMALSLAIPVLLYVVEARVRREAVVA